MQKSFLLYLRDIFLFAFQVGLQKLKFEFRQIKLW